jgi:hypothetical protein
MQHANVIATQSTPTNVNEWVNYLAAEPSTICQLFSEMTKIVQMLLVVPLSAASAEHTFSSLHCPKTWLRWAMTHMHLAHLAMLHCRRQRVENIDIERLCKEFAFKANEHPSTFGYA